MMIASVISRAARDFEFSGAGGDSVAGGLKHIPMAMTRITCRCVNNPFQCSCRSHVLNLLDRGFNVQQNQEK
jgi:hypothetical protein